QIAGGQVHAVAQPADAQRRLASHGAADHYFIESQRLDLASTFPRDHLVLANDHIAIDRGDVVSADATTDRLAERTFDFLALVHHTLGDALGRTAILRRDHD